MKHKGFYQFVWLPDLNESIDIVQRIKVNKLNVHLGISLTLKNTQREFYFCIEDCNKTLKCF